MRSNQNGRNVLSVVFLVHSDVLDSKKKPEHHDRLRPGTLFQMSAIW